MHVRCKVCSVIHLFQPNCLYYLQPNMPSETSPANIQVAHQISSTLHVEAFAHHGAVGTMSSAESIIAVDVGQLTDGSPKSRHLVLVQWDKKGEHVAVVWTVEGGVTRVRAIKDANQNGFWVRDIINTHWLSLHVLLSLDLVARRVYTCESRSAIQCSPFHIRCEPFPLRIAKYPFKAHVIWTRQVANACKCWNVITVLSYSVAVQLRQRTASI